MKKFAIPALCALLASPAVAGSDSPVVPLEETASSQAVAGLFAGMAPGVAIATTLVVTTVVVVAVADDSSSDTTD